MPLYWQQIEGSYFCKVFADVLPLSDCINQPCQFINWYEANAYCLWSGTRLPTEWEWQLAASLAKPSKFPALKVKCWNDDQLPNANFMGVNNSLANAADFSGTQSYFGCQQMLGNTWEWTSSSHFPLDGYKVDEIYAEYSATSFGYHKVLKGGSWASNAHFVSNNFRNFYLPHRSDVFAGFRVCKS